MFSADYRYCYSSQHYLLLFKMVDNLSQSFMTLWLYFFLLSKILAIFIGIFPHLHIRVSLSTLYFLTL